MGGGVDVFRPRNIIVALLVIAVVGVLAYVIVDQINEPTAANEDSSADIPGQFFEDLGRSHLQANQPYDEYNSNPPTSGPHDPVPAPWGVSADPIPKEKILHNLEHGGVAVLYNCTDDCPDIVSELSAYVQGKVSDGDALLMAPYPGMEHRIALISWTRLDAFDELDMERVERFVDVNLCRFDPENVCD
ncbi:MAG TPA: DUF3105 domain-containing protein [Dehalococcoidia bacterium]|nr:DUF3105 domain-containing protein [Dehalococcoidia bacterium]